MHANSDVSLAGGSNVCQSASASFLHNTDSVTRNILLDIDLKATLSKLPVAEGASFNSYAEERNPICLPSTRVDLLDQISKWAGIQMPRRSSGSMAWQGQEVYYLSHCCSYPRRTGYPRG